MLDMMQQGQIDWSFHILIKDTRQLKLFFEDCDYHKFLSIVSSLSQSHDCPLHAYTLMPDEVHLLMSRNSYMGIEGVLRKLQLSYCDYYNNKYRRTFRLLKLTKVSGAIPRHIDLLGYYRYIEMVPVMAGVVDHPSEYPWSSYGSNAMGEDCGMVSPHHVYTSLATDDQTRRECYRGGFDQIAALTGIS